MQVASAVPARLDLGHPLRGGEGLDRPRPGRATAATMSMSLAVSAKRRRLPAISHALDVRRSAAQLGDNPLGERPQPRHRRGAAARVLRAAPSASPARIAASVFSPRPGRARMRPSRRSLAHVLDGRRSELGEDPAGGLGPDARARASPPPRPGGLRSTSRSSAAIWPVSSSSATLSAIVSPTPGSSVSLPCSRQPRDRLGGLAQRLGGTPVGEHAVDHRALQLQQVGHQLEALGDGGVRERRGFTGQ